MRISDCSSDVGSSDLPEPEKSAPRPAPEPQQGAHADQPKPSLIHSLRPGRMAARDQQKVGAPPCREARSYFARAPAVKYQSCLSASANRPSISVRCSALVTGVTTDAGKGEFVSSKYCLTKNGKES